MRSKCILVAVIACIVAFPIVAQDAFSVRLKDIAYVQGIRENQLAGFGLVTGLEGKGDSAGSALLKTVIANMLSAFSIAVPTDDLKSRNSAVVMVTSDVPSFIRAGDRIDVHVSSIGDAKSLNGGVLLQTPLKGANGQTYAVAQGVLASIDPNAETHGTVSMIPGGAIVEQDVLSTYLQNGVVSILLRNPDFTTAARISGALQSRFPGQTATAVDASLVRIELDVDNAKAPVGFVSAIEELRIVPDTEARVVINPRSGIVVVGKDVKIGQVAITLRDTKIEIGPPSRSSDADSERVLAFPDIPSVNDLVRILQTAGMSSDDIIEILKGIDRAGALYGRLIIM